MDNTPASLAALVAAWPRPAQDALHTCRKLFHTIADTNMLDGLDETLKWGQPAWRPVKPRTGSTLRLLWQPAQPHHMAIFVDCKTDLAARMGDLYPELAENDLQRRMSFSLNGPLPEQALSHLAQMTFTYHIKRRTAQPAH